MTSLGRRSVQGSVFNGHITTKKGYALASGEQQNRIGHRIQCACNGILPKRFPFKGSTRRLQEASSFACGIGSRLTRGSSAGKSVGRISDSKAKIGEGHSFLYVERICVQYQ